MADLPEILEKMSEGVHPALTKACTDAMQAREQVTGGQVEDDLETIHFNLVHNRAQIERLEHLTATLLLIRSRFAKAQAHAKGERDDAYNAAAIKKKTGFDSYVSAKEKDAHAAAASVSEEINLRKADAALRDADAAWDFCRLLLRGAEGAHRDLEVRVRLISLSGQLDR